MLSKDKIKKELINGTKENLTDEQKWDLLEQSLLLEHSTTQPKIFSAFEYDLSKDEEGCPVCSFYLHPFFIDVNLSLSEGEVREIISKTKEHQKLLNMPQWTEVGKCSDGYSYVIFRGPPDDWIVINFTFTSKHGFWFNVETTSKRGIQKYVDILRSMVGSVVKKLKEMENE